MYKVIEASKINIGEDLRSVKVGLDNLCAVAKTVHIDPLPCLYFEPLTAFFLVITKHQFLEQIKRVISNNLSSSGDAVT